MSVFVSESERERVRERVVKPKGINEKVKCNSRTQAKARLLIY